LKHECHSKTTVQLKECSPKVSWSISLPSFTWCRYVAWFCHPSQTKTKREVEKALVLKQCVLTAWCHMADWCNRLAEVWPWPPISSSFTEAVTVTTVRKLPDSTLYMESHHTKHVL
jgi:hypothetical protein